MSACEFRSKTFRAPNCGAYVTVYQYPGKRPQVELAYFDGERDLDGALDRMSILADAMKLLHAWWKAQP